MQKPGGPKVEIKINPRLSTVPELILVGVAAGAERWNQKKYRQNSEKDNNYQNQHRKSPFIALGNRRVRLIHEFRSYLEGADNH